MEGESEREPSMAGSRINGQSNPKRKTKVFYYFYFFLSFRRLFSSLYVKIGVGEEEEVGMVKPHLTTYCSSSSSSREKVFLLYKELVAISSKCRTKRRTKEG